MTPVLHALPGPPSTLEQALDLLHREREWSGTLADQVTVLVRERAALKEQLRISDEIADSLRIDLELLRDRMCQCGLNPEHLLED